MSFLGRIERRKILQAAAVYTVPTLFLVSFSGSALAQLPQEGRWAIDYARSDPGEVVWEFETLEPGLWQFHADGRRILQFRTDDEECASCIASEPWKLIARGTWDTGWIAQGWAHQIIEIAPDGGSLSVYSEKTGSDGERTGSLGTFERLSGGPGLAGTWRMETERSRSAPLIELEADPYDVLVFKSPTEGMICVVILDGNDHPCFSALRKGWTRAMTMTDAGVLKALVKAGGETVARSTYTVSADGRSMIERTVSASGRSLTTAYRRQ